MAKQNHNDTETHSEDDTLVEQNKIQNPNSGEQNHELMKDDKFSKLQEENKALKDQMLRLAADMENLRRRTERDMQDARLYSVAQFARDMLSVADNLDRALKAIPEGQREEDKGLNSLAEGVEMTQNSMLSSLERHGVKKIEPIGEKFDPNYHQAMFEIPDDNVPNNTILEVVQAGFIIGNRVLRPALVGVSKNAQKTPQNN